MRLIEALRYSQPESLAFVGAGGKTTALFQAAREIIAPSRRGAATGKQMVMVTTTTHLGAWQAGQADHCYQARSLGDIEALRGDLPDGIILVTGEENDGRLGGLKGVMLDELEGIARERQVPLLIEADGAHGRPLKAPETHEPAIPGFTQQVVVVAGMNGLGRPLTGEWVHRDDTYAEISNLHPGEQVTEEAMAAVLMHKRGGLKNIPCGARRTVLLNQADTQDLQSRAKEIAARLIPTYASCIIASLASSQAGISGAGRIERGRESRIYNVTEAMAGIILAAGESSRFGKPKQLAEWNGQALVRYAADAAISAGLDPVVMVLGSSAEMIQPVVQDLTVEIVINGRWKDGISSSIQAGLRSLPDRVGGVVFLQADQPQISPTLIKRLVQGHESSLSPIIAPLVNGQRGNPVLFDAITFSQLLALEGDMGGRALFGHFPVTGVMWDDEGLLVDIDTPEDLDKLSKLYPEGRARI
jgi:molybdenum cofactor cytidylyltransferase